jgi:cobalt/nickel transport system ATP-binding protein
MNKAVEIINFSFHYADGTAALHDVSLTIEHGQKVALIGPNGAGKSSLLLALAGFAQGKGIVRIDGLDMTKVNLKAIRQVLGCCLENPDDQLFMPTLRDDIAFGPLNLGLSAEEIDQRVTEALNTVELLDKADKPPHHLSAGQKRAAAIATVLSMTPKIITLDEPDGSLDPRHRRQLQALLKSLKQTLIIATCNMNFAYAIADRVVLIDEGRIIADGPPDTLMTDKALMLEHGLELPAI